MPQHVLYGQGPYWSGPVQLYGRAWQAKHALCVWAVLGFWSNGRFKLEKFIFYFLSVSV
jgi:hypothetical protein